MQNHHIQRVLFDIDAGRRAGAAALQQRVSSFAGARLGLVLERCLNEFGRPDVLAVHERLELDLGTLSSTALEGQMAERISHRLRDLLARLADQQEQGMAAAPPGTPPLPDASDQAALAALGAFLAHGRSEAAVFHFARCVAGLADRAPQPLKALLRECGARQAARRRLACQLPEALIERLVAILEPAHASLVLACAADLGQPHVRVTLAVQDSEGLRRAVWEFVLAYLLVERGSHFNTRAFAASVLRQMAGRFGVQYTALLEALGGDFARAPLPFAAHATLPGLIAELLQDAGGATASPDAAGEGGAGLDGFAAYLAFGMQAGSPASTVLARLLDDRPDALRELLRRLGAREEVRRRLAQQMPEPLLARTVHLLEPAHARLLVGDAGAMRRMHADQALVPQGAQAFGRIVWQLVLDYLLSERGSHFNRRSFIKSALHGMAARCNMTYRALLTAVLARLPAHAAATAGADSLAAILLGLSDEAWAGPAVPAGSDAALAALAGPLAGFAAQLRRAMQALLTAPDRESRVRGYLHAVLSDPARRPVTSRALLRAIAAACCARYGMAYGALLARLAVAPGLDGAVRAVCLALMAELDEQASGARAPGEQDETRRLLALLGDPARAAVALREADLRPDMIRRLLEHAPRKDLLALLDALEPGAGGMLAAYLRASAGLGKPSDATRIEALHWALLLEILLERQAPRMAISDLLVMLSGQGAQRLGMPAFEYRARLLATLERLAPRHADSARLRALAQVFLVAPPAPQPMAAAAAQAAAQGWAPLPMMPAYSRDALTRLQVMLQFGGDEAALAPVFDSALRSRAALKQLLLHACGREPERSRLARGLQGEAGRLALQLLLGAAFDAAWRCLALLRRHGKALWSEADLMRRLLASIADQQGRRFEPGRFVLSLLRATPAAMAARLPVLLQHLKTDFDGRHGTADKAIGRQFAWAERRLALAQPWPAAPLRQPPPSLPVAQVPGGASQYVGNAGLVLLWPFLQGYFEGLDMLDARQFRTPEAQCRAAQLLQYLASGEIPATEEGQLLNKLLCGIEPARALDFAHPPGEQEAALAEQLLGAVTHHWSKLKNTSAPVLRSTFLMRGGRLLQREEGWQLQVNGSPFDPLLQSLPWGLSTVRLPWMPKPLWVEWKR